MPLLRNVKEAADTAMRGVRWCSSIFYLAFAEMQTKGRGHKMERADRCERKDEA